MITADRTVLLPRNVVLRSNGSVRSSANDRDRQGSGRFGRGGRGAGRGRHDDRRPRARKTTSTTQEEEEIEDKDTSSTDEEYPPLPIGTGRRVKGAARRIVGHCRRSHSNRAQDPTWYVCPDSGATDHMHMRRAAFEVYEPITNGFVPMGDGSEVPALGRGTIALSLDGKVIRLRNVLHVPTLGVTLISIRVHHRKRGCGFVANADGMFLTFSSFQVQAGRRCR